MTNDKGHSISMTTPKGGGPNTEWEVLRKKANGSTLSFNGVILHMGRVKMAEDSAEGAVYQPVTRSMDISEDLISNDKNAGRALAQAHGKWPQSHYWGPGV